MSSESKLANLDAQIASERSALAALINKAMTRIIDLTAERERVRIALQIMPGKFGNGAEGDPRPRAPAVLYDALSSAPEGLTGARLHELGKLAGMTKSAVDRSRSRLKKAGKVQNRDGLWFLTGENQ
jgi:hypothetical protein